MRDFESGNMTEFTEVIIQMHDHESFDSSVGQASRTHVSLRTMNIVL